MKNIDVIFDKNGYIEDVADNSIHIEQENKSLLINATIETDKKVRAYIKAPNNNSAVTDELTPVDGVYSCVVEDRFMAKGTLYVGYELYDNEGYIERLEPLKIYIDSFVSLGTASTDNVYTVTVKIGEVKTVDFEDPARVENVGTKKDMVLNFDIPRGDTGLKGDTGPQGEKGEQGIQGEKGEKGADGEDGYTPQKGVDYFTEEDIKSLGITNKVDWSEVKNILEYSENPVSGKAILPVLDQMVRGDYQIDGWDVDENGERYGIPWQENTCWDGEDYKYPCVHRSVFYYEGSSDNEKHLVFSCSVEDYDGYQLIIDDLGEIYIRKSTNSFDFTGVSWTKVSVSQTDLENAIGDVEASLESIIEKKVEKEEGKGLSTNDFTDELKSKVENNTFDYYAEDVDYFGPADWYENNGIYLLHGEEEGYHTYAILAINGGGYDVKNKTLLELDTGNIYKKFQNNQDILDEDGNQILDGDGAPKQETVWEENWTKYSVSQRDLTNAIGDIEASLESIIEKYGLGGDGV